MFWNINGRGDEFCPTLTSFINNIDILLLAESKIADSEIKTILGFERVPFKTEYDENEFTPKLYSRIPLSKIEHYSSAPSKRIVFYTLDTKEKGEVIIAGLHFPSKATYNGETQLSYANNYAKWVREVEVQRKHEKTIVFGDFNMNPFEPGMIETQAFNATLSYDVAKSGTRRSHFDDFHFFYNPMWNWLGDREYHTGSSKLPGTFYYKTTTDVTQIFWNVFDKVIIRPSIIDVLDYSTIKIHEAIPRSILIKHNFEDIPDNFTDHLPLTFNLKLTV